MPCKATRAIANRQIISVNSEDGHLNNFTCRTNPSNIINEKEQTKLSPDGEVYGFGEKFRKNRKNYFDQSCHIR